VTLHQVSLNKLGFKYLMHFGAFVEVELSSFCSNSFFEAVAVELKLLR